MKDLEQHASMEPEHLDRSGIKRGVVGTKFLPQHPLSPRLLEQTPWHTGVTEPSLPLRHVNVRCKDSDTRLRRPSSRCQLLRHHAAIGPHHQYPKREPRG
jgi:hypothetical protein